MRRESRVKRRTKSPGISHKANAGVAAELVVYRRTVRLDGAIEELGVTPAARLEALLKLIEFREGTDVLLCTLFAVHFTGDCIERFTGNPVGSLDCNCTPATQNFSRLLFGELVALQGEVGDLKPLSLVPRGDETGRVVLDGRGQLRLIEGRVAVKDTLSSGAVAIVVLAEADLNVDAPSTSQVLVGGSLSHPKTRHRNS